MYKIQLRFTYWHFWDRPRIGLDEFQEGPCDKTVNLSRVYSTSHLRSAGIVSSSCASLMDKQARHGCMYRWMELQKEGSVEDPMLELECSV